MMYNLYALEQSMALFVMGALFGMIVTVCLIGIWVSRDEKKEKEDKERED